MTIFFLRGGGRNKCPCSDSKHSNAYANILVVVASASSEPPGQGPGEGDQEEPEEVQRPVQRQGQDETEQGQQGALAEAVRPVRDVRGVPRGGARALRMRHRQASGPQVSLAPPALLFPTLAQMF